MYVHFTTREGGQTKSDVCGWGQGVGLEFSTFCRRHKLMTYSTITWNNFQLFLH